MSKKTTLSISKPLYIDPYELSLAYNEAITKLVTKRSNKANYMRAKIAIDYDGSLINY